MVVVCGVWCEVGNIVIVAPCPEYWVRRGECRGCGSGVA